MIDSINQSRLYNFVWTDRGWFMVGFVFDPRLHDIQPLVLCTVLIHGEQWTDTIVFAKLNKPPPPQNCVLNNYASGGGGGLNRG